MEKNAEPQIWWRIIKENKYIEETLQQICHILPKAWQYPEYTVARINYDSENFLTSDFKVTEWSQIQEFETIDNKKGIIEIHYTNLVDLIDCNLKTEVKSPMSIRRYNEKCKLNLPIEYKYILKYINAKKL